MPVILRVNEYVFFFYSNEGDPREPIHVHARGGGGEAKIWLEPTVSLDQSKGFNTRQLADMVRKRAKQNSGAKFQLLLGFLRPLGKSGRVMA
ncbi:DUF4160 domain-containing protein [Rhizobium sp. CFBP 8762]|uniref:DUF4160 domain-containing protein n=1 Tax=Rhizobium sp. CFBP 8762 TaxID=2775279 RepID=UPI0017852320|nr:DUF4160 domain-containing protein [Rhizobium sp. CFBP 8762]MBD8553359.1 DUF4160 domain-containing protein [Rhizobium sp. CFBP 8762]